ncbi:uncharacterized protein LOC116416031 [Nasonia vitripennis]|uniref:Uncharacterized protein n=1 Tax=Nasonia vitripennis TaxID=7425 RepID=A0A7M7PWU4_NASVI|nr:uncharacterized protein LOC116416031 [Nasonia vitripennis]
MSSSKPASALSRQATSMLGLRLIGLVLFASSAALSQRLEQQQQQQQEQQPYVGVRSFRKELTDPRILAVHNDTFDGHTRLSYVKSAWNKYSDETADGSTSWLVYNVVIETYVDGLTFRKSCWTNLTAQESKENVRLVSLQDSDRAVLMWTEMLEPPSLAKLKVYLVDAKNCSWKNVTELTVNLPLNRPFDRNVFVVPYTRVFDLMFSNLDSCKRRLCRASYDIEGRIVGNVSILQDDSYDPSLSSPGSSGHLPHFAPVLPGSAAKGYFMFVEEADQLKLKTLDPTGELSNSRIAHVVPRLPEEGRPFITSNSHETFGYCFILLANRSIQCRQYDSGLNIKSNLTWTLGYNSRRASMLNLASGGFLLLTEDSQYGSQYLTKVESDGRRSDPMELTMGGGKGSQLCGPAMLYEKSRGDFYCAYGLCWDQPKSSLKVDVRCVPKRYFAAK